MSDEPCDDPQVLQVALADLALQLAAEREARLKAEEAYKSAAGCVKAVERELAVSEAGAASYRMWIERYILDKPGLPITAALEVNAEGLLACTDTGARLADLLGEWLKEPCESIDNEGTPQQVTCAEQGISKANWCLRCRLHEVMGVEVSPTK